MVSAVVVVAFVAMVPVVAVGVIVYVVFLLFLSSMFYTSCDRAQYFLAEVLMCLVHFQLVEV